MQKKKKPNFIRQGQHRKKRVGRTGWRKPRGKDSHQKRRERGRGKHPNIGYSQPLGIRGKHPSGYAEVMIHNLNQMEGIDPKIQAIRISATVGNRKKTEMMKKAGEKKIKVLNPKIMKMTKKEKKPEAEGPVKEKKSEK